MSEEHDVTFNIELNVERAMSHGRQLETVFYRALAFARRLGLPENIDQAAQKVQMMTMQVRLLHSAIVRLEASTPYGWVMALLSVMGVALTAAEMTHEFYGDVQGH